MCAVGRCGCCVRLCLEGRVEQIVRIILTSGVMLDIRYCQLIFVNNYNCYSR